MKLIHPEQYDYWRQVAAHASTPSNSAPWPVQMQLAALVGEHEISGASAEFVPASPAKWSVVAVTDDGRLVKVVIEFDAEGFDLEAERSDQEKSPDHRVIEGWVRQLKDVVGLEIRKLAHRRGSFNRPMPDQVDVGDVRLRFVGDEYVDLGVDQVGMAYHENRKRTDQLIAAIRDHTGL